MILPSGESDRPYSGSGEGEKEKWGEVMAEVTGSTTRKPRPVGGEKGRTKKQVSSLPGSPALRVGSFAAIVMDAADNVATVLRDIGPHTEVELSITGKKRIVRVSEWIRFGHKFAIRDIKRGERIVKYGEPIGTATRGIRSGQHVHVHNLESARGRGDQAL